MNLLGTHLNCGGTVVLVAHSHQGYRLCTECNRKGGEIVLVEEQPKVDTTVKATLSRKVRAFQYASKLKIGYVIGPEEEKSTDDFGIYMQIAFIHYGIDIEQVVGGWKVVERVHRE